jgi:hypothetical protein
VLFRSRTFATNIFSTVKWCFSKLCLLPGSWTLGLRYRKDTPIRDKRVAGTTIRNPTRCHASVKQTLKSPRFERIRGEEVGRFQSRPLNSRCNQLGGNPLSRKGELFKGWLVPGFLQLQLCFILVVLTLTIWQPCGSSFYTHVYRTGGFDAHRRCGQTSRHTSPVSSDSLGNHHNRTLHQRTLSVEHRSSF